MFSSFFCLRRLLICIVFLGDGKGVSFLENGRRASVFFAISHQIQNNYYFFMYSHPTHIYFFMAFMTLIAFMSFLPWLSFYHRCKTWTRGSYENLGKDIVPDWLPRRGCGALPCTASQICAC